MRKKREDTVRPKRKTTQGRYQVFNPSTGHFILKEMASGKILEVKTDGKPFKGVRKVKSIGRANPNVDKAIARKAESAVIKVLNEMVEKNAV